MSSDQTPDNSCPDDASSNGAKDDDEDEDEDDDKLDGISCGDPEKLKAFNVSLALAMVSKGHFFKCKKLHTSTHTFCCQLY